MSSNYLVELQKKNPAKQKKGFEVFFHDLNKVKKNDEIESEMESEREIEKPKEKEEGYKKLIEENPENVELVKKQTKIKLIDKTKTSVINRETILKRIKEGLTKKDTQLQEEREPIKEPIKEQPKLISQPDKKIKITIKKPKLTIGEKIEPSEDKPEQIVEKPKRGRPKIKIVTNLARSEIIYRKNKSII
jgi:hypothetical protein